jgi:hypothetical protein
VSKVEHPRPRHLLVRFEGRPVSRGELQDALKARLREAGWSGPPVRLTRFAWPHACLMVEHTGLPRLRELVPGDWGSVRAQTLRASGTLRALTRGHPDIAVRPR